MRSTKVRVIFKYHSNLLEMAEEHQSMRWICISNQNIRLTSLNKRKQKKKVELDEKFYPQDEEKSDEEIHQKC